MGRRKKNKTSPRKNHRNAQRRKTTKGSKINTFTIYEDGVLKHVDIADYVHLCEEREATIRIMDEILSENAEIEKAFLSKERSRLCFALTPAYLSVIEYIEMEADDQNHASEERQMVEIGSLQTLQEIREQLGAK